MTSERQSLAAFASSTCLCVLYQTPLKPASATLCVLCLPNLARLPMILKKIRWEGIGYSRVNSNRVSKLLHLSKRSNSNGSAGEDEMEIEEEERNIRREIETGRSRSHVCI